MKKSILFSVFVVGATLLQAQSITVHQTCGQNGQVLILETNGHECVDLGLPSGTLWATCNVGATTPEDYGDYFAWGETSTKETYSWDNYFDTNDGGSTFTKYNNEGGKKVLDPEDDAAHVNWGGSWRMPTKAELQELYDNCTWTWTTQNGINGYKVTSNKEGYTDKFIFLPAAGNRYDSVLNGVGSVCFYWSSSLYEYYSYIAWKLTLYSDSQDLYNLGERYSGFSVRPVLQASSISSSSSANDTIRIYSNGCDDYQTFIGSHGGQLTMSANSVQWSHFVRWNDGNTDNPRTITTNGNADYTAEFAKYIFSITKNAEHGTISGNSSAKYLDEVTLTANPDYGYYFTQWSDGNKENPRIFQMTQDTSFTAEFAKNTYTITTESSNPQWGTTAGDNYALYLDEVEISATANYGYHFDQWIDTIYLEVDFSTVITASQAYNIASQLEYNQVSSETYTIHGYVRNLYKNYRNSYYIADTPYGEANFIIFQADKPANIGDHVLVHGQLKNYKGTTPETNSGALLHIISPEGTYVSVATTNTNPRTIKVERDMRIWAEFAKNQYRINGNTNGHGTVGGTGSFDYLSECTIQANPDYGYHFVQWSDGETNNPRTFILTQDTTFIAEFEINQYSIHVSCDEIYGHINGENGEFDYMTEHTYEAVANYGYHFVRWSNGNTSNPYTITLRGDMELTAEFAKNMYTIQVNCDELKGHVTGTGIYEYLDVVTLTATPNYGYHFTQWSDGNTENPRTIVLTQDTTFTAEIVIDRTGTCGDDNALTWTYDPETKTLTITGNGALNSNYYFGIEAPTQMQKLVIGNEVTSIGDSAFYGMSTINHLIIGGSVATIGNYAFAECRNFDDITCLANVVPVINETTFANVGNKQYIYLFVPAERERAYHRDAYWCEFDIQVQQAEETTVTTNDVQVEPQDNAATLTWPTNGNAASYTIEITKDGVLFCTLTFNANGQLTGIAFAPSRDGQAHAPQAIMTANGLQFTVTGLDSNTQYGYNLIAKDANNQPIATYSGEFTTTGEIATGIDNIQGNEVQSKKFVRNGQIFILRGDKIYTLQGQEIIVP